MKIKVTFEMDTEKLSGMMNSRRIKMLLLDVDKSLQKLKDIGEYLDAHGAGKYVEEDDG